MFKNQNGITLAILVITVIVLGILASVVINISDNSIIESKKYDFTTELELIQQKMLIINKEIDLGSTTYENIGIKYDDLDDIKKNKVQDILTQNGVSDYSDFVFMTSFDLEKIGLKNIKQDVIISYGKSVVYSYTGLTIDGKAYYSLNELKNIN